MIWRKRGLVWAPPGTQWWARSHAYLPTPVVRGDRIRVYFAGLDEERIGRVGYVDLDRADPTKVIGASAEPVLDVGPAGTFDDCGISPCCVVERDGVPHLYYVGWQRLEKAPYLLFAGVARDAGERFERCFDVPVLDRTHEEPYVRSANTIVKDGDGWRMWYVSATGWIDGPKGAVPKYIVREARSSDGIRWETRPGISVDYVSSDEYGFGRPWVVRDESLYRMWYSIRSLERPYRIGYAESSDGVQWTRKDDEAGIQAAESGWDSEMICFAAVVDIDGARWMFYNGNGHGQTGFGAAVLEQD